MILRFPDHGMAAFQILMDQEISKRIHWVAQKHLLDTFEAGAGVKQHHLFAVVLFSWSI